MAHASRFLPRGSVVLNVTQTPSEPVTTGLSAVAAVTPDNALVVIAINPDEKNTREYQVVVNDSGASSVVRLSLPPNSLHTIVVPLGALAKSV